MRERARGPTRGARAALTRALVLALALTGSAGGRVCSAAAAGRALRLRAERVRLAGEGWEAEGRVEAQLGPCRWEADALRREAGGAVGAEQLRVTLCAEPSSCRGPWVEARRVTLDGFGGWRAQGLRTALCGCWPALRLEAARAALSATDGRLYLVAPRLRWGRLPLAWAPFWALPTRAGTSGLLWPVIGYSGRDGLRVEQGGEVFLGRQVDARLSLGWIATRGLGARARLRYFTAAQGDGALHLQLQQDASSLQRWRGRLAGRLLWQGSPGALGLVPALVSDRQVLADLARSPRLVFAPYARSRAWASTARGPVVATVVADRLQGLRGLPVAGAAAGAEEGARLALRTDLLPLRVLGPLHLLGAVELSRSFGLGASIVERGPSRSAEQAPSAALAPSAADLTVWRLAPSLAAAGLWGPWVWSGLAGYRLQALLRESADAEGRLVARQGAVASWALALPLRRTFRRGSSRWLHGVEPFVGGRWRRGTRAVDPALVGLEPWAWAGGALLELGARSSLLRVDQRRGIARLLHAEAALQLTTGGVDRRTRALATQLTIGALKGLRGSAQGWVDWQRRRWVLDAELCREHALGEVCAGYWRLRGARADALRLWDDAAWPTLGTRATALLGASADQLGASALLRLGLWRAEVLARLDPLAWTLTQGQARLASAPIYGCLDLALAAQLRAGQRRPDILAQLSWRGAALARCGRW
ncbi:MAG: hypothetical protein IPL40_03815 [Proteobacteria bacterium]|nr:hypothetical protein [Pseudomonadota bacterium]